MSMKKIFLFLMLTFTLCCWSQENSKGILERTKNILFQNHDIQKLSEFLQDKNYPKAYTYIANVLKVMRNKSPASVDYGTWFWFKEATHINMGVGSSSIMIRTYMIEGLKLANREIPNLQTVSDNIAKNVITDIIESHGVPPLHLVLAQDINAAMILGNIKDLAGWGGSFYYWEMPMVDDKGILILDPLYSAPDDYLTVGDSILRDPDQTDRFIKTCILAMTAVPYSSAMKDPEGLMQSLKAIRRLPESVRLPIIKGIKEIDFLLGTFFDTIQ